mmetsp:Transcript_35684/g.71557  ORF Transcript_35684/g.71557 Transcript_35684/m.71557 type:complete len:219 (-) Transcript_35684:121-777(-)
MLWRGAVQERQLLLGFLHLCSSRRRGVCGRLRVRVIRRVHRAYVRQERARGRLHRQQPLSRRRVPFRVLRRPWSRRHAVHRRDAVPVAKLLRGVLCDRLAGRDSLRCELRLHVARRMHHGHVREERHRRAVLLRQGLQGGRLLHWRLHQRRARRVAVHGWKRVCERHVLRGAVHYAGAKGHHVPLQLRLCVRKLQLELQVRLTSLTKPGIGSRRRGAA